MRFLRWFPAWLCCALGFLPALTPRCFGVGGVYFKNTKNVGVWVWANGFEYGTRVNPGDTGGPAHQNWSGSTQLHIYIQCEGWTNFTDMGMMTCTTEVVSQGDIGGDCSGLTVSNQQDIQNYCVYPVNWTNTGRTYAAPVAYVVRGNTVYSQTNFEARVVAPGVGVSFSVTNNIGTNTDCGYLIFGDSRDNATVPDLTVDGTRYSVTNNPAPPSGSGNPTHNQGPITGGPGTNPGGSTNGPSQDDVFRLGDTLTQALAEIERAIEIADAVARSNAVHQAEVLDMVLSGVTNGVTTNLAGILELMEDGKLGSGLGLSNLLHGVITNGTEALSLNWSNYLSQSGWVTNLQGLVSAEGGGFSALSAGLIPLMESSAPGGTWGVITVKKPWTEIVMFTIDLKKYLSLELLDGYVPGFRGWLKVVVMWGLVAGLVVWLMQELRLGVRDALTPKPMESDALAFAGFGAVLGPVGAATAGVGAAAYKATMVFALIAAFLSLPSICAATVVTSFQYFGFADMSSAVGGVTSGSPAVMWNVVGCLNAWLPMGGICVVAINSILAAFTLDGTVTWLMMYVKVSDK